MHLAVEQTGVFCIAIDTLERAPPLVLNCINVVDLYCDW
jgi:hypothetical protein